MWSLLLQKKQKLLDLVLNGAIQNGLAEQYRGLHKCF